MSFVARLARRQGKLKKMEIIISVTRESGRSEVAVCGSFESAEETLGKMSRRAEQEKQNENTSNSND